MNRAAGCVMKEFNDIIFAYGQSDEFSFIFRRSTTLYGRRESKIISSVVSIFSSAYTFYWKEFFSGEELQFPPSFDSRAILYPNLKVLRDYMSWRQVDCHINNLYNTVFWAIVGGGKTEAEAHNELKGTSSGDKNEILFSQYEINYNECKLMFRKGSLLFRSETKDSSSGKVRKMTVEEHCDVVSDAFWSREEIKSMVEESR
jgi:tRNA(His) guanylyltransferase